MFDFRINTFLTLCQTKNYTKAAQLLHITQPAVTGHIKYLEERYQMKLFEYTGKTLMLTSEGKALQQLATTMHADLDKALHQIKLDYTAQVKLNFGATLTISEYTMPHLLKTYMHVHPTHHLCMYTDNTHNLLKLLNEGQIDFALIEGYFNKTDYTYRLLTEEPFIAVCSRHHPLAHQTTSLDTLCKERLIIREPGSGSRAIFERALYEQNLKISAFNGLLEVGNLNVIKKLVADNLGITFIYQTAVQNELNEGLLAPIHLKELNLLRAFYFICPKNSLFENQYLTLFNFFKQNLKKDSATSL